MLRGFQLCLLVTLHHTVRKKFTKIEISINIYRWGGVKVTFRWHFNDIWHSLHLRSKYSLISIFIPIFFFQCSNFLPPPPLPPPPPPHHQQFSKRENSGCDEQEAVILFLVEDVTYNIGDQKFHEFEVRRQCPEAMDIRKTLTEMGSIGQLTEVRRL